MMLVVYAPHLDMVLPTIETDLRCLQYQSRVGLVSVEGGFLIEARVELSGIPRP